MEITRRRLLSALSAAGLLTVIPTGRANAADAAADSARLLANTVGVFAGTEASNSRTETAAKRAAIDKAARANLKSMDAAAPANSSPGSSSAPTRADSTRRTSSCTRSPSRRARRARPRPVRRRGGATPRHRRPRVAARALLRRPVQGLLRQLVLLGDRPLPVHQQDPRPPRRRGEGLPPGPPAHLRRLHGRVPAQRHRR